MLRTGYRAAFGSLSVASAVGLWACGPASAFVCESPEQCGAGVCEPSGYCSFPDDECPSGRRYGTFAGDGLANACVELPDSSTGETSDSTTTTSTTDDSGTNADGSSGIVAECGNGVPEGPEECDDGNEIYADGCNPDCFESGSLIWELTHEGGATAQSLYDDVVLVDDEPIVTGWVQPEVQDRNGVLVRYDGDGGNLWSQTLDAEGDDDELDGIATDGATVYATGASVGTDPMSGDPVERVWLVTTAATGGLPVQFFGPPGEGIDLAPTPNGVVIAGILAPNDERWAGEFTLTGEELFSATAGDMSTGELTEPVVAADGTIYAAGQRVVGDQRSFVVDQVTAMGLTTIASLSGPFDYAGAQALAISPAGDLWAGGYVNAGADTAHRNWLVRRYRATGEIISEDEWTQPGSVESDEVEAITIDPAGDVIAGGFTAMTENLQMMVRKYAPDGSVRWTWTYDYGGDKDVVRGVAAASDGTIFVVGEVTEESGQRVGWLGRLRR